MTARRWLSPWDFFQISLFEQLSGPPTPTPSLAVPILPDTLRKVELDSISSMHWLYGVESLTNACLL